MQTTAQAKPRVKMTIRVYRVDRHGTITQDRGTVISIRHDEPCTCCQAGQAVKV